MKQLLQRRDDISGKYATITMAITIQ